MTSLDEAVATMLEVASRNRTAAGNALRLGDLEASREFAHHAIRLEADALLMAHRHPSQVDVLLLVAAGVEIGGPGR